MTENQLPVLIVGAGPTGLTLGCELARRSIAFRIIDKKTQPTQTSNALGIQTRTIELLDDMGIVDRFLAVGNKTVAVHIHADGKDTARVPLDHIDSFYKFVLMVPQNQSEKILEARLNELGAKVERNVELISLIENPNELSISLKHETQEETIKASYVVACDGSHSAVREILHVPFPGEDIAQEFVVADLKVETKLPLDELNIFFGQGKVIAFFPIEPGRYRIAANLGNEHKKEVSSEELKTLIEERSHSLFKLKEATWISPFWIHSNVIKNMQHHRVFFSGDAAHIHSPMGGQGMNTGIQDVYNLAWKLALVLEKKAAPTLLNSYHIERHPVIQTIVKGTEKITKLMLNKNPIVSAFRTFIIPKLARNQRITRKIAMRLTQLAIHYKESPIIHYQSVMSSHSPQPGEHAPDVLINSNLRLIDVLRSTQHTLLVFTGLAPSEKDLSAINEFTAWAQREYGELLIIKVISAQEKTPYIHDAQLTVHHRYGVKYPGVYLIRPDKYIAYCSNTLNQKQFEKYLRSVF